MISVFPLLIHGVVSEVSSSEDTTGPHARAGSGGLRTTIVIVCVVPLIVILVLVLVYFFYRRRALRFDKFKRESIKKDRAAVNDELPERDRMLDPTNDEFSKDPGNQLYSSLGKDDDKEPMLCPGVRRVQQEKRWRFQVGSLVLPSGRDDKT